MNSTPIIKDSTGRVISGHPSWKGDGSGNGGGGDMDGRIQALENGMTDVKVALGKIETRLDHIERNMVTKGQLSLYALLAVLAVLGGGWWIVQQYLSPILQALPK